MYNYRSNQVYGQEIHIGLPTRIEHNPAQCKYTQIR